MGKQIINILPEGSAVLNPDHVSFCITGSSKTRVSLPVFFNATVPAEIEFIRIDLDTNKPETIKVPARDVNRVAKQIREHTSDPNASGFQWDYPIKKPGVYRLGRVLDEYKLEVQRSAKDTYVVPCPQARFQPVESADRCIRDLSNFSLDVYGTPPLKIVYGRSINGANHGFHFQSLQPDGFTSPLLGASSSLTLDDGDDVSWVRAQKVTVSLNESLTPSGEWAYTVDEIHDAFGNVVQYQQPGEDSDKGKPKGLSQTFAVKERPKMRLKDCDLRKPLKVAKGRSARLPVDFGAGSTDDATHKVTWEFSPINSLTNSGNHGNEVSIGTHLAKSANDMPLVSEPGLYTLKSVTSGSCEGEVSEPSSCLLLNPLEPHLSITSEEIPDKCAGNTVGLRVDLDLVGTPPFNVKYDIISDGHVEKQTHRVSGLRAQLELIPQQAGRHRYIFTSISDYVYRDLPLTGSDKVLEQFVKPAASALIANPEPTMNACLDSEVEVKVVLLGDAPFNLEWEIVHDGKRKTHRATDIHDREFAIKTSPLSKGGEYILALSSVQDKRGCRTFLSDELKISVRRQHPRGAFGMIEQKNSILAVEGTDLRVPLRLQGEAPWAISYRNTVGKGNVITMTVNNANDHIIVRESGIYELTNVSDQSCPGTVDLAASKFKVGWFPRPEISMVESDSVKVDKGTVIKQDVCEGDIDGFEVNFQGMRHLSARSKSMIC